MLTHFSRLRFVWRTVGVFTYQSGTYWVSLQMAVPLLCSAKENRTIFSIRNW